MSQLKIRIEAAVVVLLLLAAVVGLGFWAFSASAPHTASYQCQRVPTDDPGLQADRHRKPTVNLTDLERQWPALAQCVAAALGPTGTGGTGNQAEYDGASAAIVHLTGDTSGYLVVDGTAVRVFAVGQ